MTKGLYRKHRVDGTAKKQINRYASDYRKNKQMSTSAVVETSEGLVIVKTKAKKSSPYMKRINQSIKNSNGYQYSLEKAAQIVKEASSSNAKIFVENSSANATPIIKTEENIPSYNLDHILQDIKMLQDSSGYENVDEFKHAIDEGEVKNYSRALLKRWEILEGFLKK
ncbi:MAG: hypothetical protein ABF649_06260 [Bacillus sp. (in: firmicutes)]